MNDSKQAGPIRMALARILEGEDSHLAQGFAVNLPAGFTGAPALTEALEAAYGTRVHPDLRVIEPDNETISVETIRDVQTFLASSPTRAKGMKTLVVVGAHLMTISAANAFLKPLEEPTARTRIILLTNAPGRLPPTILSRCDKRAVRADRGEAIQEVQATCPEVELSKIEQALDMVSGNPMLAARVVLDDLAPWLKQVSAYLDAPGPRAPLGPATGKGKLPAGILLDLIFQVMMQKFHHRLVSGEAVQASFPAFDIWSKYRAGADRKGLDARARLEGMFHQLASA